MGKYNQDLLNVTPIWNLTAIDYHQFINATDSYTKYIEEPIVTALASKLTVKHVLDLGCGSGRYAFWFAARGTKVVGIDLSTQMLMLARQQAVAQQLSIDWCQGDIRKPLPFPDASFDLVFSSTVLHYVQDLLSFFKEIRRVLTQPGNLLISALHPISTGLFPTIVQDCGDTHAWQMKYFDSTRRQCFVPWARENESALIMQCYHHTMEEYWQTLTAAGFILSTLHEPQPPPCFAEENAARFAYSYSQPLYLVLELKTA